MTLAALVATSGAGCTTGQRTAPPSYDEASPSASTSPAPTVEPSVSPAPPEPAPARPVTIALAGDVHVEGVLRGRLADPATALAPVTSTLAAADVAVVNLETSVGVGGAPEPGKRYAFQAPPSVLTALAAGGVDVATMANNHALDFGRAPLPGLFGAIERVGRAAEPLRVVGIGQDVADAFAPAVVGIGGTLVATIGTTVADQDPTADPTGQWAATADSPGTADALADPARLLRVVRAADRDADVVVVYVHWGVQGERCPSEDQRSLARRLMTAGADVVAGSHTHGLQGDGPLDGPWGRGYVAYGLGNYAWYTPTALTGVLTLTVQPAAERAGRAQVTDVAWEPAAVGADGLPAPLRGAAARDAHAEIASLRGCAGLGR